MKNIKIALAFGLVAMGGQMLAIGQSEIDVAQSIINFIPDGFKLPGIGDITPMKNAAKLGLQVAEFGINAEPNFQSAKEKLKAWLMSAGENQAKIQDLIKQAQAAKTDDEKLGIYLAMQEAALAPNIAAGEFLKEAGEDLFAELFLIVQGLSETLKAKMTFANGVTMGEGLKTAIEAMNKNLAFEKDKVLPKLKDGLEKKGVTKAEAAKPATTGYEDF